MENNPKQNSEKLIEEEIEQKLIEAKKIKVETLLKQGYYIDFNFCGEWIPARINKILDGPKYEIEFLNSNQIQKATLRYSSKMSYFLEHNYEVYEILPISEPNLGDNESSDSTLKANIEQYFDNFYSDFQQGKYTPYEILQHLNGKLFEQLEFILELDIEFIVHTLLNLLNFLTDIVSFVYTNHKYFNYIKKNRIIILTERTCSILFGFNQLWNKVYFTIYKLADIYKSIKDKSQLAFLTDLYIKYIPNKKENLTIHYPYCHFFTHYMESKGIFKTIIDILTDKNIITYIPFPFIQSIQYSFNLYLNFNSNLLEEHAEALQETFLYKIQNISEYELRDIKKNGNVYSMAEFFTSFFTKNIKYSLNLYYHFLLKCLQSQSLEKRLSALNSFSEHIEEIEKKKFECSILVEFLVQNKVIQILLGENVHDELLKRSLTLFHFLAQLTKKNYSKSKNMENNNNSIFVGIPEFTYDLLWENYLNKHESVQIQIENIICDIATELPNNIRYTKLYLKLKSLSNVLIPNSPKKFFSFMKRLTEGCLVNYYPVSFNSNDNIDIEKTEKELYGIPFLLKYTKDYIIDEQGNKIQNNFTNIKSCISYLVELLKDSSISEQVIELILEKLIMNIKNNDSVNQSIYLFKNIIKISYIERGCSNKTVINILDNKYDLLTLIVDSLSLFLKNKKENKLKDELLFYDAEQNISIKLTFIFFFISNDYCSYVLELKGEEHLLKLFDSFHQYDNEEISILYDHIEANLKHFDKITIDFFFDNILTNENYFNPKNISEKELNVFIEVFKKTNTKFNPDYTDEPEDELDIKDTNNNDSTLNDNDYPLFIDNRGFLKVRNENIKGMDTLYKLLIETENISLKETLCSLLSSLCLDIFTFENFAANYWKNFLLVLLDHLKTECYNKNSIGILGLVKLIEKIYVDTMYEGKTPSREDAPSSKPPYELYKFYYKKLEKNYKIKVNNKETILDVRWKIGYYYDFKVNTVTFSSAKKKRPVNRLNDDLLFHSVFSNDEIVNVNTVDNILINYEDNPKSLIENNSEILDILLSLLHNGHESYIGDIWKIIHLIPKKFFSGNKFSFLGEDFKQTNISQKGNKSPSKQGKSPSKSQQGKSPSKSQQGKSPVKSREYISSPSKTDKEDNNNKESNENIESLTKTFENMFDSRSVYVQTFTLDSIYNYLEENLKRDEEKEKVYLSNFNKNFKGNSKLLSILNGLIESELNIENKIEFECLYSLLKILYKIYSLFKYTDNKLVDQLTKLIKKIMIISTKSDHSNLSPHLDICCEKIFEHFLQTDKNSAQNIDDEIRSNLSSTSKIDEFFAYEEKYYWKFQQKIIEEIFSLIDVLYQNDEKNNQKKNFLFNLLENPNNNNFYTIFIERFILIHNPYIKIYLYNYLKKNFSKSKELCSLYLHLAFKKETFDFINSKDKEGTYLLLIRYILKLNGSIKADDSINENFIKVSKQIMEYISKFTNEKENLIKGYLNLLYSILLKNSSVINYIIKSYDIYNFLLKSCVLSKCNPNPFECSENKISSSTEKFLYNTVSILCKKNFALANSILTELNKFHTLGFWKTSSITNWKICLSHNIKSKFVGLQNLGCTCYMNSILQQFYMIPELRKSMLSFPLENNELYKKSKSNLFLCNSAFIQLKNLFACLNLYESQYYTPKLFACNFDDETLDISEQMDADEFYGKLIDKLEGFTKDNADYKNMFKYFFGGFNVDELLFKDCGHKRENEFFFNSIQLQVAGKHNLEESLSSYVKGEMMEGDNAIICEECKKKVPALKRQSIKILPRKLVIVLKRFEFDYDTMLKFKVNDYFAFPKVLDMYPYTQSYNNNKEENKKILYDLTGVVIHVGTSESGHYYSLIKDTENSKEDEPSWYEFNDTSVTKFDILYLENEAFGGSESTYNRETGKKEYTEKTMNAYILFYDRREKVENNIFEFKVPDNFKLEEDLMKKIKIDMYQYWVLKSISSEFYQNFMLDLMKINLEQIIFFPHRNDNFNNMINEFSILPKRSLKSVNSNIAGISINGKKDTSTNSNNDKDFNMKNLFEFGFIYFMNVIIRCKFKEKYFEYVDVIKTYINSDIEKAIWVIEEFSNLETINELIVDNPNSSMKKVIIGIIYCSLLRITKQPTNRQRKQEEEEKKQTEQENGSEKDLEKRNLNVLYNFAKVLIYIIKEKNNVVDLEFIYMTLYRTLSVSNNKYDIIKFLLEKYSLSKTLVGYFMSPKQKLSNDPSKNKTLLSEIQITKEELAVLSHSALSQRNEEIISSNIEEKGEKKSHRDFFQRIKKEKYLVTCLILLIESDELFEVLSKNKFDLLSMLETKLNGILVSKRLINIMKGNHENTEIILNVLTNYINENDVNEIIAPLIILKKVVFNINDQYKESRIIFLIDGLKNMINKNLKYYNYIDRLFNFLLNLYDTNEQYITKYSEKLDRILEKLFNFYKDNPIQPLYYVTDKEVVLYKRQSRNIYPKVSQSQYKLFEERNIMKTNLIISVIHSLHNGNIKEACQKINTSFLDEDYTDFKFIYGDKINMDKKIYLVVKAIDESIFVVHEDEEKGKKYETIDTDSCSYELHELKEDVEEDSGV